jgi:hypothetical protein
MICSKTGAAQWLGAMKRMCVLVCAAGAVTVSSASCSSAATPPQAYVSSLIEGSQNAPGACAFGTQPWVNDGTYETSVPTNTAGTSVTCTVAQNGTSFNVDLNVQVPGPITLTIRGTLTNDATATQTVTAAFGSQAYGDYAGTCTVDYLPVNEPKALKGSTSLMGVFPGRVWGNLTCPTLMNTIGQTSECLGTAEFKFEDCSE